ncbi:MAG: ABC transporter substrate-binding protein [Anaerolineales bacterium]|nr:ABC transporter substrate-binding protein [Anaerolineales bacterium]
MLNHKRVAVTLGLIVIASLMLGACAPATPVATSIPPTAQVIIQTQIVEVEGTPQVQEVVVTATPAPVEAVTHYTDDPTTFTELLFGDIDTMDPNLAYDTASGQLIQNIMEPLIFYNHTDAVNYVPVLATEVPSVVNGGISADGKVYTFNIRSGVTFHNGNDLTASDAAYTFWRGLLQSDPNGPQWLLLEPILGYHSGDVTEEIGEGAFAGDREALVAGATPEELAAVCEKVKAAIVADDAAGTLTFNLVVPWGPFLATLAQTWGSIIDEQWAVENGAWDGDCATWQNWYAPGSENDELSDIINGTGPYVLDHWTPGEEYVLTANPNYWRAEGDPIWEGGPSGIARTQTVIVKQVAEWGTRFAAAQAGDADFFSVNPGDRPQADEFVGETCDFRTNACTPDADHPDAALRKWGGLPATNRTDLFMNFNVAADDSGSNPYIGSGALDGNGVPADFFSDIHVRKAFAQCFDYDTYIADGLNGEGIRNNGPIILDMLGYNPDGPMYQYDLDACGAELAQAWGGVLPDKGFRLQATFNTGNTARQTVAAILQNNLAAVNAKYRVEIVGLPWPTLLAAFRARQLPLAISGWAEDIHDPHNWVQPFTVGTFAGRQNLPDDLKAQFQTLVDEGVAAVEPADRAAIYYQLQQLYYDEVPTITLAQATGAHYEQRWVENYFYNPIMFGYYYYAFALDGGSASN